MTQWNRSGKKGEEGKNMYIEGKKRWSNWAIEKKVDDSQLPMTGWDCMCGPYTGPESSQGPYLESDKTRKASLTRFTSFSLRSFMKWQAEWGCNPAVDKTAGNRPVCGGFIPVSLCLLWSSQQQRRVEGDSSFSTSLSYSFISHSPCQSSAVSLNT